ncbi:MAG: hypothetical protein ACYTBZ_30175, partial [Planctomycetota bacterium]
MSYHGLGQGPTGYGPAQWKDTEVVDRDKVLSTNQAAAYMASSARAARKVCPGSKWAYDKALNKITVNLTLGDLSNEPMNIVMMDRWTSLLKEADAPCRSERTAKGEPISPADPPTKPEVTDTRTQNEAEAEGEPPVLPGEGVTFEVIGEGVPWWVWAAGAGALLL